MAPPIKRPRSSSNAIAFAELCLALNTSSYSKSELTELVGISIGAVTLWIKYLHKRKLIHICEWRKNHVAGAPEALWTWGFELKDVPRPKAKTQAEYSRTYRQRKLLRKLHDLGSPSPTAN